MKRTLLQLAERQLMYCITAGDGKPNSSINDDGIALSLPDYEEVPKVISRLKNSKAVGPDGWPVELFKYGREELLFPDCLRKQSV